MSQYLKDYVWMAPPDGGPAEQVPAETSAMAQKMNAGWKQVDQPEQEA